MGLGKTIVGLLLIRKFIDEAQSLARPQRVLVVTPPAIRNAWERTIAEFDADRSNKVAHNIDFISTGSIGKILTGDTEIESNAFNDDELHLLKRHYGLVVIDESHNFRNNDTNKYQQLRDLIRSENPSPFVALLSATPQNNSPFDIKNQIYLFIQQPNRCILPNIEGGKLDSFFSEMQKKFYEARNNTNKVEAKTIIEEISTEIRNRVLNELVVRRTRADVKTLYPDDTVHLHFPKIKGPNRLEYEMDAVLVKLFADTMNAICFNEKEEQFDHKQHIGFERYAAISYFTDSKNTFLYSNKKLSADHITKQLKNIMRISLVKRLESSFAAFKSSLNNLLGFTENMIYMLENNTVFVCPDIDVNAVFKKYGQTEIAIQNLRKLAEKKGKNNLEFRRNDFHDEYITKLQQDKTLISSLINRWNKNDYDPKFDRFKEAIKDELFDPKINNPHHYDKPRLVIFTEAIDTLRSLKRALEAKGHSVLEITAQNRDKKQLTIVENFDANIIKEKQRDDYDVILTTEVLAEGVNLHRSNVILNYDAPWNATRLMQRIGRVNRIGSKEDYVHVFNFFPSVQGNQHIRLIEKAYAKLQAFHIMFGEDNKVFSELEELTKVDLTKIIDGEASLFAPYIIELQNFQKENPNRYNILKEMNMKALGGSIAQIESANNAVFGFTDQQNGLTCTYLEKNENGEVKAKVIAPLAVMETLKCEQHTTFVLKQKNENYESWSEIARKCYAQHVVYYLSAKDANKRMKEASHVIEEIKGKTEVSKESKLLLNIVRKAVENNDSFIIKILLKYKEEADKGSQTLFGIEYDINAWIETTFKHLLEKAKQKRGDTTLAFYEIK